MGITRLNGNLKRPGTSFSLAFYWAIQLSLHLPVFVLHKIDRHSHWLNKATQISKHWLPCLFNVYSIFRHFDCWFLCVDHTWSKSNLPNCYEKKSSSFVKEESKYFIANDVIFQFKQSWKNIRLHREIYEFTYQKHNKKVYHIYNFLVHWKRFLDYLIVSRHIYPITNLLIWLEYFFQDNKLTKEVIEWNACVDKTECVKEKFIIGIAYCNIFGVYIVHTKKI